jgi:hypothetical protein
MRLAHRGSGQVPETVPSPRTGLTAGPGPAIIVVLDAGWSSLVARRAHNPKVAGSNPAPAIPPVPPPKSGGFLLDRGV